MRINGTERRVYPTRWEALSSELQVLERVDGNLLNVVERLRQHQHETGFVRDDLHAVRCFSYPHPDDPHRFLSVQYNPARVSRLRIRVGALPPLRGDAVNDNCFLCQENIQWQHRGLEYGYPIDLEGTPFQIWMNAYPLMPQHVVVATRAHIPQGWTLGAEANNRFDIGTIVRNLSALSQRLPGHVGFYNGEGAGTSVPEHFHYQFFRRRDPLERFPLELAPLRRVNGSVSVVEDYPVEAVCWRGTQPADVVSRSARWIQEWLRTRTGLRPGLSGNIFVMTDADGREQRIYFVPRDRELLYSPHMAGMIGCLELLGEIVLTTETEKHDLDRGYVDYQCIARILSAIRVPL